MHGRPLAVRAVKEDLPGDRAGKGETEDALVESVESVAMVAEVEAVAVERCFRVCERVQSGWLEAHDRSTHLFAPLRSRESECHGTSCSKLC